MKKYISILLVLLLMLTLFTACGDKNTDADTSVTDAPAESSEGTEETEVYEYTFDGGIKIGEREYSLEECNLCYADVYYSFIDTYGYYAVYYGIDITQGIESLTEQECDYSADGTWHGYFVELALRQMMQVQALCEYADENGVMLSKEELLEVSDKMDALEASADEDGFLSVDGYLTAYYGSGVTTELYREYIERLALADKIYSQFTESLSYTDEELLEYFATLEDYQDGDYDYALTSMRHVLIMAEADEDGEYTDEAITAAHDRAQELYDEWLKGDMSEESFAELANEYSEDGGSNTNGGYYGDIYKNQMVEGINNWLFEDGRTVGDTAIIDNNGSYVGTHIVYFTGFGEKYNLTLARSAKIQEEQSAFMSSLTEDYELEVGSAFGDIGIF